MIQILMRPKGEQPKIGAVLRGGKDTVSAPRKLEDLLYKYKSRELTEEERKNNTDADLIGTLGEGRKFVLAENGDKIERNVVVFWQKKAWIDTVTAVESVQRQFKPFLKEQGITRSLSAWDNLPAQRTDDFLDALQEADNTALFGPRNATFLWQAVDCNYGAAYHTELTKSYDDWFLSAEGLQHSEDNTTPSAPRRRSLQVDWAEAAWEALAVRRRAKEAINEHSLEYLAFARTPNLVSMTGQWPVDELMKPEGVMAAVKASDDPWYTDHKVETYQGLFLCAVGLCDHAGPTWEVPSKEEQKQDEVSLAKRFAELTKSADPRAKLLSKLLRSGYTWAGSSFIVFLGGGLDKALPWLAMEDNAGDNLHDADVYCEEKKLSTLSKELLRGWRGEPKDAFGVQKYTLTHTATKSKMAVDCVSRGSWTLPGSDLFASLHARFNSSTNTLGVSLYHADKNKPPRELSLHNALRYDRGAPVDCYTFRSAICPTVPRAAGLATNVDERFHDKLTTRQSNQKIVVKPAWKMVGGPFAIVKPPKAKKQRVSKKKTPKVKAPKTKNPKARGKTAAKKASNKRKRSGKEEKYDSDMTDSDSGGSDGSLDDQLSEDSTSEEYEHDDEAYNRVQTIFENPHDWCAPSKTASEAEKADNRLARQISNQNAGYGGGVGLQLPAPARHGISTRPRRANSNKSYSGMDTK
jgi:hypothetical protein